MSHLSALHDIALFVEIARTASFRHASQILGISSATLSRRLAAMEQRFETRLFNRTTRHVELTDAGRRYLDRCGHLADEARLAQQALHDASHRPAGHLRVSMPIDLGLYYVGPLLPEFARLNPGVTFELDLRPSPPRPGDETAVPTGATPEAASPDDSHDVTLRLGGSTRTRPARRRIGWFEQALFASPGYLALRGRPAQPSDLAAHECIFMADEAGPPRWRLVRNQKSQVVSPRGRFTANTQGVMRTLAERGMGIAALAPALWRDALVAGRLQPVLPDWTLTRLPVHAVAAPRAAPATVNALLDFLADRFAAV